MSDIVEWLRDVCIDERGDIAADEIESLRQRVKELDTEYSISVETGTKLANELTAVRRELAALKAGHGDPVKFIANGTRFNVSKSEGICGVSGLSNELNGEWVALVLATDDCHLNYTAPTIPEGYQRLAQAVSQGNFNQAETIALARQLLAEAPKPEEKK